jgi:hypothetical protein
LRTQMCHQKRAMESPSWWSFTVLANLLVWSSTFFIPG